MQSMNVSLPESLKTFVDQQIASGHYSSVSEYVRALIREDEKHKAQMRLEGMLRDGLKGPDIEVNQKFWDDLRKDINKKLAKRKPK